MDIGDIYISYQPINSYYPRKKIIHVILILMFRFKITLYKICNQEQKFDGFKTHNPYYKAFIFSKSEHLGAPVLKV